jgi:arabinose-5-phosphate isomerase
VSDGIILQEGRRVIAAESAALQDMLELLDKRFCDAVKVIGTCTGKVVATGVGKSGLIARKLASTFSSLGIPAFFVHPTEGVHGDLGTLMPDDLVLVISHSGNSDELIPFLQVAKRRLRVPIIAIVGTRGGSVDSLAGIVLETGVKEEACALKLAPTTSSTAALALCDALAVVASGLKGIQAKDFAALHPAGSLGKRLYTPVARLMHVNFPKVGPEQTLKEIMPRMSGGEGGILGLVVVEDKEHGRIGIITDGDIRRVAQANNGSLERKAGEAMSTPPRTIGVDALGVDALTKMEEERITSLVVVDTKDNLVGVVHIHDILRYGLGLPLGGKG